MPNPTNPKLAASHIPEPWTLQPIGDETECNILGSRRELIATVADNEAVRIRDCVNACAGIDPAAVPLMLEALQYALAWIDKHKLAEPLASIAGGFMEHPMRHCIRAAIAKAKGGAK